MRQNNTNENAIGQTNKGSGKSRYASKKAYFARNKDGAITKRHKANRAARAKRRAEYWASTEGQNRKFEKMNTPEKLKQAEAWKVARAARRRERKLAEQKAQKDGDSTVTVVSISKY